MTQGVSSGIKSVQIVEKADIARSEELCASDRQPQGAGLFDASEASKTPKDGSKKAVIRVVHDREPQLVSTVDPSKRRPHYKLPTPESDWDPRWKPRKRPPGLTRQDRTMIQQATTEAMVGLPEVSEALPVDPETGKVVKSDVLLGALCAYLSQGGMLLSFARKVGLSRGTLSTWCSKDPRWKAETAKARAMGVDALAEEALAMSTDPLMVEDVYERYDKDGNLLSRDIKKGDAVYARKLAVSTRLDLLKKWAPEKYGDKVEAKTDSSLASRILAARKRVGN